MADNKPPVNYLDEKPYITGLDEKPHVTFGNISFDTHNHVGLHAAWPLPDLTIMHP